MDIKDIKTLIKMVTDTDITEFEMENSEEKISIKRGSAPQIVHYQAPQQIAMPQMAPAQFPSVQPLPAMESASSAAGTATVPDKGQAVTSPIVGTFYRAPAPDAAPYVEVGKIVEKGEVLCIVEAMKLMNEIEAEFRCKIIQITKENAQPVEFGDTLFLVEPL
ncbi:acetyl-CoA carboxylase biotin carboxyl carrier protein [Geobacter sp. AOG1]|uniref:acetyl-CoA carboxylase biotin carboxyl carrier protein n=1 Tax=Geobacter sp. AOG1 TaxID=1566346 RepID=UPI001CC61F21|nr:acetyl-CoA carboxylase biotin carboxyl carrier protein [Geobacter sp. AOG1]GFE58290.1 acetyl-CoA carboxylase, biotin carboxyl carrier protein [Geobacter sp. AOG1]